MQLAFIRAVINPQCGHILCNPDPGIPELAGRGFVLRLQRSNTIMNNTISRPRTVPAVLIKRPFLASSASIQRIVQPRADIAVESTLRKVTAESHAQTAHSMKVLRLENFRWTGLGQRT